MSPLTWDFKCKVTKKWLNFEFSDLVCYGSFSQQRPWLRDWFLLLANLVGNFFTPKLQPSCFFFHWNYSFLGDVRSPQMISKDIASRNPLNSGVGIIQVICPVSWFWLWKIFRKKLRGVRMLTSLLSLITLRPWQVRFVIKCRESVEGQPREEIYMADQPTPTRNVPTPEIRPF